jgi:hypothetical protein
MINKTFDCVAFQRKVRDDLIKEADYNIDEFFKLINKKIDESEFVKIFKERLKVNN